MHHWKIPWLLQQTGLKIISVISIILTVSVLLFFERLCRNTKIFQGNSFSFFHSQFFGLRFVLVTVYVESSLLEQISIRHFSEPELWFFFWFFFFFLLIKIRKWLKSNVARHLMKNIFMYGSNLQIYVHIVVFVVEIVLCNT